MFSTSCAITPVPASPSFLLKYTPRISDTLARAPSIVSMSCLIRISENAVTSPELVMAPDASVPANVTFAPLAVITTVFELVLNNLKLPLDSVTPPKVEPASKKLIVPPPASKLIFAATSIVKLPEDKSISVPSIVMLSTMTPAFDVIAPVNADVLDTASVPVTETPALEVARRAVLSWFKVTSDNGIDIDNINIDGTTIALSSGDLTVDVAGDIILDADGGDIFIKDGGTQVGSISNAGSNNFQIASSISDGDLLLKGNDGGSTITALTLDMSAAGAATFNSSVTAGGDVTAFSDMRIKHDIQTIEGALAKVSDMRGVYFKRNDGEAGTGVIAQEIENILPEVVKDGEYKSVAYGNMVGILIEAIKELKAEVEKLKESK